VLDALAIDAPTRIPRFVGALLVFALAFVPFVETRLVETTAPTVSRCGGSMLVSDNRPRAIRTRTHALNPRYMTRRHCTRDSAGRISCAR
jgi:hypothetical protein